MPSRNADVTSGPLTTSAHRQSDLRSLCSLSFMVEFDYYRINIHVMLV